MATFQLSHIVFPLILIGEELRGDRRYGDAFLGSTFPINTQERLYFAAAHTIPNPDVRHRLGITVIDSEGSKLTRVTDIEFLQGQPDVAVLRAQLGAQVFDGGGLAGEPSKIWEDVVVAGYPEQDIRPEAESGLKYLNVRGLKGFVSRIVAPGEAVGVDGDAYEVSFPIPAGMSGGPAFALNSLGSIVGLIGVCRGNVEANSFLWQEEVAERPGGERIRQKTLRAIEFGIVSSLHKFLDVPIRMVGKPLGDLLERA